MAKVEFSESYLRDYPEFTITFRSGRITEIVTHEPPPIGTKGGSINRVAS